MKRPYLTFLFVLFTVSFLFIDKSYAQAFDDLDQAPHDISYYRMSRAMPPLVKVLYGRPQNDGEKVFGNLVPYGKIWRTGADEATEVKFYQDVVFGDKKVKAGTYVLYTIPGENEWEIILNSNIDVLGAFQYNPTYDVARITVPVGKAEELKVFSIAFKEREGKVQMVLGWDDTRIGIPLAFKEKTVLAKN
mgnify:CR=1 FL=1